ncbi:YdeI/OmpD-associated family protein [Roseivirga sp. E12]|uniref:YdeI/OmpD-associated family protein n=1 Tax=Roseivirga sp. E12 TaxID=2819237 RepID=UPI001ABCBC9F|nr:YdeI/OmpD-associated family protein [Roseivirga sp. E12]MBO3696996.1 YdeI/OmpD-associated family protein [Roseivirga sp. E12]
MTVTTTLEKFDQGIWGYHFPISSEVTKKMSSDDHRRVICSVNGMIKMHCSLMPLNDASYIMINKTNRLKLGIRLGEKVELRLEKETSEYGLPMPESLMVLLDQDEEGSEYFHALTPGKQRSLIYIVSKVKSIDKQINKSLAILEHLKDMHGKIDYRLLTEKIKLYNQNPHHS